MGIQYYRLSINHLYEANDLHLLDRLLGTIGDLMEETHCGVQIFSPLTGESRSLHSRSDLENFMRSAPSHLVVL